VLFIPPAKSANSLSEVAANKEQHSDRVAVIQAPLVELKIATLTEKPPVLSSPPPKSAKFATVVAPRSSLGSERVAVVQSCELPNTKKIKSAPMSGMGDMLPEGNVEGNEK